MKDIKQKVRRLIKTNMWLVLATVDEHNIPYSSVMVYQSDGETIICQTGIDTLKANNIRKNNKAAITIPIRKNFFHKLLPAPPAELHFTTTVEIKPFTDEQARTIYSKFLKHSNNIELPQESIWISIKVPDKITTFGIVVPLFKMRNPLEARKIINLNS
ncbi:MAG: pyridoxamine 5'-phosphate oxidase family protein [Candidatus Lokiarchaeota archaeon]|nr:pyridoxamine 5'-phosphate oxidase family protein [Candidatus Lokiarchaeota archaeon]